MHALKHKINTEFPNLEDFLNNKKIEEAFFIYSKKHQTQIINV